MCRASPLLLVLGALCCAGILAATDSQDAAPSASGEAGGACDAQNDTDGLSALQTVKSRRAPKRVNDDGSCSTVRGGCPAASSCDGGSLDWGEGKGSTCRLTCTQDEEGPANCFGYGRDDGSQICVEPPTGKCVTGYCVNGRCGSVVCEGMTPVPPANGEVCFASCPPEEGDAIGDFTVEYDDCDLPTPAPEPIPTTTPPLLEGPECTVLPDRIVMVGKKCQDQHNDTCRETAPRCVDVNEKDNSIQLWQCGTGKKAAANQLWLFTHTSSQIKWYKDPSKCLEVDGKHGLKLAQCQDTCDVVENPKWQGFCVDTPTKGQYRQVLSSCRGIPSPKPGKDDTNVKTPATKCLEALNPDRDGSPVVLNKCKKSKKKRKHQTWEYYDFHKNCHDRSGCDCDCMYTLYTDSHGQNACAKEDDQSCCHACCCNAKYFPRTCAFKQPEC